MQVLRQRVRLLAEMGVDLGAVHAVAQHIEHLAGLDIPAELHLLHQRRKELTPLKLVSEVPFALRDETGEGFRVRQSNQRGEGRLVFRQRCIDTLTHPPSASPKIFGLPFRVMPTTYAPPPSGAIEMLVPDLVNG